MALRYGWLVQWSAMVVLAMLAGAAALRRRNHRIVPLLLALVLFTGIHCLYYVIIRYRLPATMVLAIMSGGGIHLLLVRHWPTLARRLPA